MKPHTRLIIAGALIGIGSMLLLQCKKKDTTVKGCMDPYADNYNPAATEDDGSCTYGTSATYLDAKSVSTPPSVDGSVDALWANVKKLEFTAVVPDPGQDVFRGYVGNSITATLRAVYTSSDIYFLVEYADNTNSLSREPWYFDPAAKRWNQESGAPTFDSSGTKTREAFYEDKVAMLWNVNNSVANWNSLTCYNSCHTGLSSADGKARHYTNGASEIIDMWHWKMVRTNINGQFDDQFQDSTYPNGRKSDAKTSGGYTDNIQTLVITGDTTSVEVPKYVIPNKTNYYWILQSEIDGSTAKLVTAVDSNGVLSYSGGQIDPTGDVEYQRNGAVVGTKCFPSIYTSAFVGSRGDITCVGVYTGSGWALEFKRALKTSDTVNDIDFSPLTEQYFGVGIFNNAQIAHAIKTNLILRFN